MYLGSFNNCKDLLVLIRLFKQPHSRHKTFWKGRCEFPIVGEPLNNEGNEADPIL